MPGNNLRPTFLGGIEKIRKLIASLFRAFA